MQTIRLVDELTIDTPRGPSTLTIAALIETPGGFLVMGNGTAPEHYDTEVDGRAALAATIARITGADTDGVIWACPEDRCPINGVTHLALTDQRGSYAAHARHHAPAGDAA